MKLAVKKNHLGSQILYRSPRLIWIIFASIFFTPICFYAEIFLRQIYLCQNFFTPINHFMPKTFFYAKIIFNPILVVYYSMLFSVTGLCIKSMSYKSIGDRIPNVSQIFSNVLKGVMGQPQNITKKGIF